MLCLLLIGTVGCRKIIPFEKNEPTIPDGENSIPDIPEEGVESPAVKTVEYNGNLYYIQDDAICKKTLDGEILTVKQKTPGIFYAQVCVVSDWLYYISASYTGDNLFSLNRVDLNGGNDTELLNSKEFIDSPTEGYRSYRVDGGKVYLQTNFKFYRYDIGSDTVEKLTDNVSVYQIVGDRLYFIDSFNRTFTVYCMDLNTLGTSIVLGDGLYHPDKTADVLYKNFVFIGEDLYVLTRNPEGIYKCKDGKTAELISNGTVYDYFLSGQDGMLWYLEKPDHGLWVLKQYDPVTKQSSEIATVDDMASSPELIGNRFYYRDSEQNLREIVLKRERYYSKEDFASIVEGESTYRDVYSIAQLETMQVTSYGGVCEYPTEKKQWMHPY